MYQEIFKENKHGIVINILCVVVIAVIYKLLIKDIYDEMLSLNIKQLNDQQEKSKPHRNSSYFENYFFMMMTNFSHYASFKFVIELSSLFTKKFSLMKHGRVVFPFFQCIFRLNYAE